MESKRTINCPECGIKLRATQCPGHVVSHWGSEEPLPQWSRKAVERRKVLLDFSRSLDAQAEGEV